jgi:hypothetical protein
MKQDKTDWFGWALVLAAFMLVAATITLSFVLGAENCAAVRAIRGSVVPRECGTLPSDTTTPETPK